MSSLHKHVNRGLLKVSEETRLTSITHSICAEKNTLENIVLKNSIEGYRIEIPLQKIKNIGFSLYQILKLDGLFVDFAWFWRKNVSFLYF